MLETIYTCTDVGTIFRKVTHQFTQKNMNLIYLDEAFMYVSNLLKLCKLLYSSLESGKQVITSKN